MTAAQEEQLQDLLEDMGLTHDSYHGKLSINYQRGEIKGYTGEETTLSARTLKLTEKRR